MFSKFFEKKKSNGISGRLLSKKKRKTSSPNQSCASKLKYFSPSSNSPSPEKQSRFERRASPVISSRYTKGGQIPMGKYMNQNHLKIRQSQSPRGGRSNILKFFKQKEPILSRKRKEKPSVKPDEYLMAYGVSSKQLGQILGKSKPKGSRESSKNLNRSSASAKKDLKKDTLGSKGEVDKYMISKRRLNKEFLASAKNNNVEKCLELIGSPRKKNCADINARDSEGWTALHHAAWNGNLKFLNILLYNDAALEIKDKSGVNPITLSVAKGHSQVTQVLLNAGADFSSRDTRGNTPLHYAAVQNNIKCMELMLAKGADAKIKNDDLLTPLDMASEDYRNHFLALLESSDDSGSIDPSGKIGNKSTKVDSAGFKLLECVESSVDTIGPKDFKVHGLLGKGSFGEVYLVEKLDCGTIYAMKVLHKSNIIKHNLTRYAMTEKNVLSCVDHPFIVRLHYSFQTADKLFMILDFCPGGDLGEHLQNEGRFSEDRSKIYICEIILALEELHQRNIIYRDLKPDNIVLDTDGHAMLTDFGLSKEDVSDYYNGAKSFCGSVAYLAPEMLKRAGHGKAVDWYLLGVVLYEMLVGLPPYYADSKEELFDNIENAPLKIPSFLSCDVKDLLKRLLERDPMNRLGSGTSGSDEIKRHKWFNEIQWDCVLEKKMKPPKIKKKLKLSKKNIPKDLLSEGRAGKGIKDWTFIKPDVPISQD